MSIPELVTIHTSLLTGLGNAVRERFGVSGKMSIEKMTDDVTTLPVLPAPLVPSGYTQVEYLESSGTQYIDTGYTAIDNTRINCVMYMNSDTPQWYAAWGATSGGTKMLLLVPKTTASGTTQVYAGSNTYTLSTNPFNTKLRIAIGYNVAYLELSLIDFNTVSISNKHATQLTLGLFAGNDSGAGGFSPGFLGRIYDFQIFEDTTEVMHFVPCIRDSDGEAGMYDIIGGQFYTNAGTGTFITP